MLERNNRLLSRKYKEYLFPTIISGMSILLGSIVDGIIVGQFIGPDAMAAVNVTEPFVLFFQAVFFLIGIGGSTLVAVSKGERRERKANVAFTLGVLSMLAISAVTLILGSVFIDPIVRVLCNDPKLLAPALEYLQIMVFGTPFMIVIPGMVYFVRVDGMPKLSARILLLANVVNLLMDLVYINVFHMGIRGAALATVTGYAVGIIPVLWYLFTKKRTLSFVKIKKGDLRCLGEITNSGLASFINTCLLFLKTLFLNRIVMSTAGTDGMIVFSVCSFSLSFVSMFVSGGAETMVPLLGMLYGEKDRKGMDFVVKRTFLVVGACAAVSVLLMEVFPVQILGLFNITGAAQIAMGVSALRVFAFSLLLMGISITIMYYMQTIRQKNLSVMVSVLRGFLITVPCAWLLAQLFGAYGIWFSFLTAEVLTLAITLAACKWKAARSKGKYTGVLLHEKAPEQEFIYDVSIESGVKGAVDVSEELIGFCRKHGLNETKSNLVGLMAEEAAASIASQNGGGKAADVDILCKLRPDSVILSLRDDGRPFDAMLLEPEEEERFSNISIMNKIADEVSYSRTLGLNSTLVVLSREGAAI